MLESSLRQSCELEGLESMEIFINLTKQTVGCNVGEYRTMVISHAYSIWNRTSVLAYSTKLFPATVPTYSTLRFFLIISYISYCVPQNGCCNLRSGLISDHLQVWLLIHIYGSRRDAKRTWTEQYVRLKEPKCTITLVRQLHYEKTSPIVESKEADATMPPKPSGQCVVYRRTLWLSWH
jgi:hypothetical protein